MKKYSRKRIKGASLSLVFTVLFIAAVIVLNAVFKSIADAKLWYFDMTEEQVFSLSDETVKILKDVDSEVNIYFTQDGEKLMSGDGSSQYMKYIYRTALQLEKQLDFINVECVDIVKNPGFFEYYYNTSASKILTTSVIVESGGEFRLFASDAFFVWDEDYKYIWAYNGEAKLASAILQVTADEVPSVCFTTGHGEEVSEKSALWALCEEAGYKVKTVDLSCDDITDDVRILIVNNPVYDFAGLEGGESGNEIKKLDSFLDSYGCVMVFSDAAHSSGLTGLSELLLEWGIEFCPGETVYDTSNSLSVDGKTILAQYESENTLGASLYSAITELSSMPKCVLKDAMPLNLLFEEDGKLMGSRTASPVLYCADTAEIYKDGALMSSGRKPLAVISRDEHIENNDYFYSYVFVCGCPGFASDAYLNSNAYSNRDILMNTIRLTGREKVVAESLEMKVFDNTKLDITTSVSNRLTAVFAIAVPAVVAVLGSYVYFRRRHS